MGCKRYDGCIICVLFQISWQLQTQIVKNRIISDSLLGNKLYDGLSQVYCIKPEGRNPLVYKGLKKEENTSSLAITFTCI